MIIRIVRKSASAAFLFVFIALLTSCPASPITGGSDTSTGEGGVSFTSYYIATNGSDTNDGLTKDHPLLSVQCAINLAVSNNITPAAFYVQEGYYTTNLGMTNTGIGITLQSNHNFRLYGGCDSNFISQNGRYSVLDGQRVLNKILFAYNSTNVTLDGFIFLRGKDSSGYGGGVFLSNVNSSLITNCQFISNEAWNGGGLNLYNSQSNVVNAVFLKNSAAYGGGTMLYAASGYNRLVSSYISNSASQDGGGISFFSAGNFNYISGLFMNNTATSTGSRGGAISINAEYFTVISDCLIINNSASGATSFGGGIASFGGWTSVQNCVISNNTVGQNGGGCYLGGPESLLSNNVISRNRVTNTTATCKGGGATMNGNRSITTSCAIMANTTPSGANDNGGGLYIGGNSNQVFSCLISGNYGFNGGGIYMNTNNYTIITNSLISSNTALTRGGGICLVGGFSNSISADISWNSCTNNNGGGIYVDACDFTFVSGNIASNYATNGGGIFISGYNTQITNAVIRYNKAGDMGGGVYVKNPGTNVTICADISFNNAAVQGGGVYATWVTNIQINSVIANNSSDQQTGGVYTGYCSNTTLKGTLSGNSANYTGGAMTVYGAVDTFISAAIINNVCTVQDAGFLYTHNSTNLRIVDCVITNNYSLNPDNVFSIGTTTGLMVSNCLIGGANNTTSYAFYEMNSDSTGQIFKNNIFLTNTLCYLYRDYAGAHLVNSGAGWTNINIEVNTGAATADGNTAQ